MIERSTPAGDRSAILPNRLLLWTAGLALTTVGLLFIHSTIGTSGTRSQAAKAVLGVGACWIVSRFDYRIFSRWAWVIYGGMVVVLFGLLVLRDGNAKEDRWIDLGVTRIQPSELMKIAVVIALAEYLKYRDDYRRIRGLIVPYGLVLVPMGLVALQPDLGTSLMLPPILLALLFIAGARAWPLLATVGFGVAMLPAAYYLRSWFSVFRLYQLDRVVAFFEQSNASVQRSDGYQLYHSLVAFSSGGMTGHGLGHGIQNSLGLPPERQTDFIFSIIGEEWGFAGCAVVIGIFIVLIALCLRVALATREPFGRLVASGVAVAFAAQAWQNMGMTIGLSPVTGLPLPFVSFGGSSLVTSWLALGIVLAVASRRVRVVAPADLAPRDPPKNVRLIDGGPGGLLLDRWPV